MASHAAFPSPAVPLHPVGEARAMRLVDEALVELQADGRKAIRIVHAGCGSGAPLIRAVVRALELGFVAVEARGFDESADDILIARLATATWRDPRLGLAFEQAEIEIGLAWEEDQAVDILLCARGPLERLPIAARARVARDLRRVADRLVLTGDRK
jgi:hypothetical protein